MADPVPQPPQADQAQPGHPAAEASAHSARYLVLRILAAVVVAGLAFAAQRLVLADEPSRDTFGATVRTKEVTSDLLERTLPVKVVVPKGAPASGRGLVVFLHGRGEDETSYLVEPMFEALSELRTRAPVMAFPAGDESSYWHDRESGEWGTYVLTELIPALVARFDVDPDQVVLAGISMGGFGAYDIARLDPGRFCAVAGHSPAIWESSGDTADGAFDDADDFARNDIVEIASSPADPYSRIPRLWIDAGTEDPFLDGDEAFEGALRAAGSAPVVRSSSGGHDNDYWNDNWDDYIGWYAYATRKCEEAAGGDEGSGSSQGEAARAPDAPTEGSGRSSPRRRGAARAGGSAD